MSAYEVTSTKDTYTLYELKEKATSSRVTVCPERGGIVLNYSVRGEELLYLDRNTFLIPRRISAAAFRCYSRSAGFCRTGSMNGRA